MSKEKQKKVRVLGLSLLIIFVGLVLIFTSADLFKFIIRKTLVLKPEIYISDVWKHIPVKTNKTLLWICVNPKFWLFQSDHVFSSSRIWLLLNWFRFCKLATSLLQKLYSLTNIRETKKVIKLIKNMYILLSIITICMNFKGYHL